MLKCNRGTQNGIYCDCEDGWMSSGIHQDDPMTFHWCDTQVVDPSSFSYRPRKLSKVQEVFLVIVSRLCHNNIIIKDTGLMKKKLGMGGLRMRRYYDFSVHGSIRFHIPCRK